MRRVVVLLFSQTLLFGSAALAYFGVRGLTEGNVDTAWRNAERVLELEQRLGIDFELGLQDLVGNRQFYVDLANWIYIWGHWPVVIATLVWLVLTRRDDYRELRNAMFISGAIGLVIFATFPVTPPRLFSPEYIDTVTTHSEAYRVLQPPRLVNKYAAVPSLHFGWNLLVAMAWYRVRPVPWMAFGALLMPVAMGFAVVATANHWVVDVLAGGLVALVGLGIERSRKHWTSPSSDHAPEAADHELRMIDLTVGRDGDGRDRGVDEVATVSTMTPSATGVKGIGGRCDSS